MATDRTATWNEDGSILWHTPTTNLNSAWSEDGSILLDILESTEIGDAGGGPYFMRMGLALT